MISLFYFFKLYAIVCMVSYVVFLNIPLPKDVGFSFELSLAGGWLFVTAIKMGHA